MVDWPTLPDGTAESIANRWPDRAQVWAAHVEAELRDVCNEYNATPRDVLPARYGFVIAADSPHGRLVLKASPDPDARLQADVATALANLSAGPTIHQTIVSASGLWTVMDEVRPGTPLAVTDRSTVDIDALAMLFNRINNQPPPRSDMPSIVDWLRNRLEDSGLTDLPVRQERPAPQLQRNEALRSLGSLATTIKPMLCHGDASSWNLLASAQGTWQLVDPRGFSGEVGYDLAVVALKLRGRQTPERLAMLLAHFCRIEVDRVLAWLAIAQAASV